MGIIENAESQYIEHIDLYSDSMDMVETAGNYNSIAAAIQCLDMSGRTVHTGLLTHRRRAHED